MAGGIVGIVASLWAFSAGIHCGSPWPIIVLAAPASTLSMWILGDGYFRFCGIVLGTAVNYGFLAYFLATRQIRWSIRMLYAHLACAAYLAYLASEF